jgi:hypothetical protein
MLKNLVMFTDSFEFFFKFLQFKKQIGFATENVPSLQQREILHKKQPGTL